MSIRNDALGRTGDVVFFLRVCGEEDPKSIDHSSVSAILAGSVVVRNCALDVEVEAINNRVTERSRPVICWILGAECIPQEFGEGDGRCVVLD